MLAGLHGSKARAYANGFTVREVAVRTVSVSPVKVVDLQGRCLGVPAGTGVYIPSDNAYQVPLARTDS